MKHENFSKSDIAKAEAIVSVFETGKPFGDYAAVAVLDDGAGVSYGRKQFTHRSGSLRQVIEKYLDGGAAVGREMFEALLPILRRTTKPAIETLAADAEFKKALRLAAATKAMCAAQDAVAFERYMRPAIAECRAFGFVQPLSLAVVYDSMVHGSWHRLANSIDRELPEKDWIKRYVEERDGWLRRSRVLKKTVYRTEFFIKQIARGNWHLELPFAAHGVLLTRSMFESSETLASQSPAENPPDTPPGTDRDGRGAQIAAAPSEVEEKRSGGEKAKAIDVIEARVNEVAARVDQAERIVVTTQTRSDKAKSLWTTVAGTAWQMLWAVAGVLAGVPREVWLVVAVIAGALMLLFLYRQLVLGKLRENHGSEFHL